jgi:hypothetical protein
LLNKWIKMKSHVKNFKLSKNKYLEIQLDLLPPYDCELFDITIKHSLKGDHAGFQFSIYCFKTFYFHIMIYDHRHWDCDNDCWEEKKV